MDKKTIVVVGAGQGLGNHVAKRFGKEGFCVVLMARNGESLKRYHQESNYPSKWLNIFDL